MADLYSQYASGAQLPAGTIVGSASGVSGLNPIVDRLNAVSPNTAGSLVLTSGGNFSVGSNAKLYSWWSYNSDVKPDYINLGIESDANSGEWDKVNYGFVVVGAGSARFEVTNETLATITGSVFLHAIWL